MAETLGPSRWNWINAAGRAAAGAGQKNQRVELAGPNGFLNQLTKNVFETGACGDDRAGYDGHDPAGRGRATRVTALELRRCLSSALWLPDALTCTDTSWLLSSTRASAGSDDWLRFLSRRVAGLADDGGRALFAEGDRKCLA